MIVTITNRSFGWLTSWHSGIVLVLSRVVNGTNVVAKPFLVVVHAFHSV